MSWVYVCIAAGAAGFLIWIIVDYLNTSAGLKPKADLARHEIRDCESRIESEQVGTEATRLEVESLQREVAELEKELVEVGRKLEEYRQRERRRKPTRFKLEE